MDCIFCKIVSGEASSYKVWEDDKHVAFLGIFPSTKGMTVVIPKKHLPSYVFQMEDQDYSGLMQAAKQTALLLDTKLGSYRTVMIAEGLEIDHAHVRLYPLYSEIPGGDIFGNGPRASEEELEKVFNEITTVGPR